MTSLTFSRSGSPPQSSYQYNRYILYPTNPSKRNRYKDMKLTMKNKCLLKKIVYPYSYKYSKTELKNQYDYQLPFIDT